MLKILNKKNDSYARTKNLFEVQDIVRYNIKKRRNQNDCSELYNIKKSCFDKVTDEYETLVVTRKNNDNVIILSEESYNNLVENLHVLGNKVNYDWLMESKQQLQKGLMQSHALIEDE